MVAALSKLSANKTANLMETLLPSRFASAFLGSFETHRETGSRSGTSNSAKYILCCGELETEQLDTRFHYN
jgi:hypothetical protein